VQCRRSVCFVGAPTLHYYVLRSSIRLWHAQAELMVSDEPTIRLS
jgi:hypothetical protein